MSEQPLPVTQVAPEDVATLADYQVFLKAHGLERVLRCNECGQIAEPGTGQVGWNCGCRILAWRAS